MTLEMQQPQGNPHPLARKARDLEQDGAHAAAREDLATWDGYAFDRPSSPRWESVYPGPELALRRLLYARLLTQLEKRPSIPGLGYACDYSALRDCRTCGCGSGLVRECQEGHRWFTPLGCGTAWCLRCAGMAADLRAARVHRDLTELADLAALLGPTRPVVLRIQLTLSLEHRAAVIAEGRPAVNRLLLAARDVIVAAAGSDGTMPLMLTLHPTSSRQPWVRNPHVHAVALWCDLDESGARPLAWAAPGRPIDADALREGWGDAYSGSKAVRVAYYRHDSESGSYTRPVRSGTQALASALRYDLRPFTEDVFAAVADRRLGVPGGGMADLQNEWRPPTLRGAGSTSSEVVAGLEGEGGVLMWPRFHRVRRYGCLASRGYSTRAEALHLLAGRERGEPAPLCACPACEGALVCVMVEDDDGEPTNRPLLELRSQAEGWAGLLAGPGLVRVPWEVPA